MYQTKNIIFTILLLVSTFVGISLSTPQIYTGKLSMSNLVAGKIQTFQFKNVSQPQLNPYQINSFAIIYGGNSSMFESVGVTVRVDKPTVRTIFALTASNLYEPIILPNPYVVNIYGDTTLDIYVTMISNIDMAQLSFVYEFSYTPSVESANKPVVLLQLSVTDNFAPFQVPGGGTSDSTYTVEKSFNWQVAVNAVYFTISANYGVKSVRLYNNVTGQVLCESDGQYETNGVFDMMANCYTASILYNGSIYTLQANYNNSVPLKNVYGIMTIYVAPIPNSGGHVITTSNSTTGGGGDKDGGGDKPKFDDGGKRDGGGEDTGKSTGNANSDDSEDSEGGDGGGDSKDPFDKLTTGEMSFSGEEESSDNIYVTGVVSADTTGMQADTGVPPDSGEIDGDGGGASTRGYSTGGDDGVTTEYSVTGHFITKGPLTTAADDGYGPADEGTTGATDYQTGGLDSGGGYSTGGYTSAGVTGGSGGGIVTDGGNGDDDGGNGDDDGGNGDDDGGGDDEGGTDATSGFDDGYHFTGGGTNLDDGGGDDDGEEGGILLAAEKVYRDKGKPYTPTPSTSTQRRRARLF